MSRLETSSYIPEASSGVFFEKWPADDERDFPVGAEIYVLHQMVSQPKKVLMKLVSVSNKPTNRWKVVHQTEIEEV
jgi:hypothetical protein